ncbi:MAG TPA: sensor histidine kinase [Clostridiales bacterium]|nr:sensor histidine kinase [Clostridiales bacterium]
MRLVGRVRQIADHFSRIIDDFSLKKKLFLQYILCVVAPVILLNGILLTNLLGKETRRQENDMQNIANAVQYNITQTIDDAVFITKDYWRSQTANVFLETKYASPYDFYRRYNEIESNSIAADVSLVGRGASLHLYSDNNSIINGGEFGNFSRIQNQEWFRYFKNSGQALVIYPYIVKTDEEGNAQDPVCRISVIRRLDAYPGCEKILKLDLDYGSIENTIINSDFAYAVYVCSGNKVLFSNRVSTSQNGEFGVFPDAQRKNIGYVQPLEFYTQQWNIYVIRQESSVLLMLKNNLGLIVGVVAFSVLFPLAFMYLFNRSFTLRLSQLSSRLEGVGEDNDHLEKICDIRGRDEIGELMHNYNRMAARINELIQVVYKRKLQEQEADIARQRAEVLALQSQINPHFLFNALESIRMHSIIRHEEETAEMICKLSLMMRNSMEWSEDVVTVAEEIRFAEAYLQLQKYRFGDQLSYRIQIAPDCEKLYIPKLTIVTFIENACVHGIEEKASPGWVFLEVVRSNGEMILEVEDTGVGMSAHALAVMQESMECASMERLKAKGSRVGVMNACVRIKSFCQGKSRFHVESEEGVGTTVTIHIPLECAQRQMAFGSGVDNNEDEKGGSEPC